MEEEVRPQTLLVLLRPDAVPRLGATLTGLHQILLVIDRLIVRSHGNDSNRGIDPLLRLGTGMDIRSRYLGSW